MSDFVGKDGSGKDVRFVQYDGLNYPVGVVKKMENGHNLRSQLEACRDLAVREDDVFLPAYLKSGTHWVWDIVVMLLSNTSCLAASHKENAMLDFQSREHIDSLPSPRVLNLHFPHRYFPREAIKKRCKIIHLMRNPKDVFVSYFNHYKTLPSYEKVDSFSSFLPMMLGENGFYIKQPWYEYELQWEQFAKDNPDYPILFLYYEDLKENLEKWVEVIAEFLQVSVTEETIKEIAKQCDIDAHRKGFLEKKDDKNVLLKTATVNGNPLFFRKGTVGDWKNWFTVAENERMDRWLEKHLTNTDLKFRYDLQ